MHTFFTLVINWRIFILFYFRSHTGEKPFHCKFQCTKKFSNSSDRAKHEQTHKTPVILSNNSEHIMNPLRMSQLYALCIRLSTVLTQIHIRSDFSICWSISSTLKYSLSSNYIIICKFSRYSILIVLNPSAMNYSRRLQARLSFNFIFGSDSNLDSEPTL